MNRRSTCIAILALALLTVACSDDQPNAGEVPADVTAVIDGWFAANERADGSVTDFYLPLGYHLYGDVTVSRDELASHFNTPGYSAEWITEPYLIAAEPGRRYVVTRGIRTSASLGSWETALTFEIMTMADGELRIYHTDFTYAH